MGRVGEKIGETISKRLLSDREVRTILQSIQTITTQVENEGVSINFEIPEEIPIIGGKKLSVQIEIGKIK